MTAFGAILTEQRLCEFDHIVFDRLVGELQSQIYGLSCDSYDSSNLRAAKLWRSHSPTRGFGDDKATGSWLACVGNPSCQGDVEIGASFSSSLLGAYLAQGSEAITSLSAPFAIVIYDGRDKSVNVITDRVGIQHIYMAQLGRSYVLSTSSLALASVLSVHLDKQSLAHYFLVGHLLKEKTFFEEIEKIDGAMWLSFSKGKIDRRRYWVPPEEGKNSSNIHDTSLELSNKLLQAVSRRISPDNRTSLELTGGLDSRLNLACAAVSGKPFHAWTMGEPGSLEVRITKQLKQIYNFQHYVLSAAKDMETRFMDDLKLINVLTDGETDCLNLIATPSCNRQTAQFRIASISGLGGEILRGFYYISHKGIPNRARHVHTGRLITLKMLPNIRCRPKIFSDVFPSNCYGILKQSVESYFSGTTNKPLFWRLDDFYFRAREQRFAGRSCSFNNFFYRQELPYFDNEIVEMSFKVPHQFKKNSRLVKHALAICHTGWSEVLLENGLPAKPLSFQDFNRIIHYYTRYGKKAFDRVVTGVTGKNKAIPDNAGIYNVVTENLMSDNVLKLMDPQNMASGFLYNPDNFKEFVRNGIDNGFKDRTQVGLILSFELLCRQVGSSLKT